MHFVLIIFVYDLIVYLFVSSKINIKLYNDFNLIFQFIENAYYVLKMYLKYKYNKIYTYLGKKSLIWKIKKKKN